MNKRIENLSKILEEKNLDCAVIFGDSNLYYFTGFRGAGILLLCDKTPILLASTLEKYRAEDVTDIEVKIFDPLGILDEKNVIHDNYRNVLLQLLQSKKKIGVDLQWTNYNDYTFMKENFSQLVDISSEISELRSVKTEEELENIKKAGEITVNAFEKVQEMLEEGVTEKEIAGYLEYLFRKLGAEDYAFPSIIAFNEHSAYPHYIPSDTKFKKGSIALFDIGAKYNGYCFDYTRTIINKDNEEVRRVYEIVLEAQLTGIDSVRDGIKASEVDKATRNVLKKYGYDKYFLHSTGHGVGIEIHEYPPVSYTSTATLKENMVITVEPGIYFKNKFGIRIEDTIIVTKGKAIVINDKFKEL
ncbi:MAG: Xaa-Pro peptidase family protein [Sulfolobaceae archaeon]|nr:Xaa-Pro peptidase family protein [Sulfolobaceae archaeon]